MKILSKFKQALAIGATSATLLLFATMPVSAHTSLYRLDGGKIPMYYAPTDQIAVKVWSPNGTWFDMHCWVDFEWYKGNYWTNRWFWGQEYSGGYWGYVNASYVANQTTVPHC